MKHVAIDDVDTEVNSLQVHDVRKPVSRALGTTDFAMNYFELAPGDSFSGGLHTHHDQEEVFYVESGTATFDVGKDRREVDVGERELVRFEPGEFQTGYNDTDERVVGWALGAPGSQHDWDDIQSYVYCPDCEDEREHDLALVDGAFELTCTDCGNTQG
ncbi:cupin domain-containing protein [Salarchaeum sp. JOR-1]|uniref:cupin domain-containing protein n=1 Tax=Salarchaeum sp. JOR-1 TaxID=2599399 RepID=UPI001198AF1C|nr:cupin domain-containing protein [Salarchaeum sp. JOR-1]QDX40577.1 cupin domain-containing protein [Salarchaeum sp. JOR-1]